MDKYRFYVTLNPNSDTAEADSLEGAGQAAKTLWDDAVENWRQAQREMRVASLPTSIFIECKMIPDFDNADPQTVDPWGIWKGATGGEGLPESTD